MTNPQKRDIAGDYRRERARQKAAERAGRRERKDADDKDRASKRATAKKAAAPERKDAEKPANDTAEPKPEHKG